jgi:hypothetical protein
MWINKVLCLAAMPAIVLAQGGSLSVGNGAWGGLIVRFQARLEPAGNGPQELPGGVAPGGDGARRYFTDTAHKQKFSYDLHGELLPDGQTLRLTVERPTQSAGSTHTGLGWTRISNLRAGDTAAIDLLVNPNTGQKVVEYLTVERAALDPSRVAKEPPRDFSIDDVELVLDSPRVWANGKLIESSANFGGGIQARMLWLWVPDEGTFVVSLWPESGHEFHKAGMMQGNTMTFRNGSSEYRVECDKPIAPGSGIYNVYLHWEPAPRDRQFNIGGTDKGRWISRK